MKERIKGNLDGIFANVKEKWDKDQEEKNERKRIYNEAYKTAEVEAIQEKACADAKAKYAPAAKEKKVVAAVSPEEAKRRAEEAKRMNPFGRF